MTQFSWVLYIFGAFLVITGIKMLSMSEDNAPDLANNALVRWLQRHLRVTPTLHGNTFFVRAPHPTEGDKKGAVLCATPLFLALCMVEMADLIFAVDSVPAIFAITTDPFIVYTSNIFAIGTACAVLCAGRDGAPLRLPEVRLGYGAGVHWRQDFLGQPDWQNSPWVSLGVTVGLIAGGVLVSLWKTRGQDATSTEVDKNA